MTEHTSFVRAAVLGFVLFGEHVAPHARAGTAVIVGAGAATGLVFFPTFSTWTGGAGYGSRASTSRPMRAARMAGA